MSQGEWTLQISDCECWCCHMTIGHARGFWPVPQAVDLSIGGSHSGVTSQPAVVPQARPIPPAEVAAWASFGSRFPGPITPGLYPQYPSRPAG
jgi:hypothetical protein